ncbi:MAG TPA: AAA family ATPase [Pirellulales bacterium]|nr:AAA family ATPase [Pirellulales bacterium]
MWQQRIEKLRVREFKAFADAEVELRPLNVLIGPNGAGKSALLSLLRMLRSLSLGELGLFVGKAGGADDVLRRATPPTTGMQVECDLLTVTGRSYYALNAERTQTNTLLVAGERIERFEPDGAPRGSEIHAEPRTESALGDPTRWAGEHKLFAQFRKFHFAQTPTTLAGLHECDADDNNELREDGGNLAAVLHLLEQRHPSVFRRIVASVRHVFGEFQGFSLQRSPMNPSRIRMRWRRRGVEGDVGMHQLSDGTLRFMLLATLLQQPGELLPPLLAIDEPELGLHPAALQIMANFLKLASQRAQLFVATQSSVLVDAFEPEDVVVVDRRDAASTLRRPDSVELKEWLEAYTLGELWEKNVIGGGPFG